MEHFVDAGRRASPQREEPDFFDRCVQKMCDIWEWTQGVNAHHRTTILTRILGVVVIALFCLLPVAGTALAVFGVSRVAGMSASILFWFVASLALAFASVLPAIAVTRVIHQWRRDLVCGVFAGVRDRDEAMWADLDNRLHTLRSELTTTPSRESQ